MIDVTGFSRGAALALHFANEVDHYFKHAPIRFVGLFDTVASFGKPGNDVNIGWKLTLPNNVERCFHAMALDERRGNFPVVRVKDAAGGNPAGSRLEEVWFRGVHSDIGGGENRGLTSIAITWMLERGLECGLPIDGGLVEEHRRMWNPAAAIGHNLDPIPGAFRTVYASDRVHASVRRRPAEGNLAYNNPPQAKAADA